LLKYMMKLYVNDLNESVEGMGGEGRHVFSNKKLNLVRKIQSV